MTRRLLCLLLLLLPVSVLAQGSGTVLWSMPKADFADAAAAQAVTYTLTNQKTAAAAPLASVTCASAATTWDCSAPMPAAAGPLTVDTGFTMRATSVGGGVSGDSAPFIYPPSAPTSGHVKRP